MDVNKGNESQPNYRSRLVAKEIKTYDQPAYFSATPPLEALRVLIPLAANMGKSRARLLHIDVRRAYFYAPAKRLVYVGLPVEDYMAGTKRCARNSAFQCTARAMPQDIGKNTTAAS